MIKEINSLIEKYKEISKNGSEYVCVLEVVSDLYGLAQTVRINRLPKSER